MAEESDGLECGHGEQLRDFDDSCEFEIWDCKNGLSSLVVILFLSGLDLEM
jgi:hypothetical protein